MYNSNNNTINCIMEQTCLQLQKENYIADMLVRTLYSNDVDQNECYRIIQLFKKKVLGDVTL